MARPPTVVVSMRHFGYYCYDYCMFVGRLCNLVLLSRLERLDRTARTDSLEHKRQTGTPEILCDRKMSNNIREIKDCKWNPKPFLI